ncbi:hypothetical protein V6Z93_002794 [Aspergillus fumigatus]
MSERSGTSIPCHSKVLSGHITQLLELTRHTYALKIRGATRPAEKAALYLPIDPNDALVREVEKQFNKKSHHAYVAVFFRGEFTVGEMYDTIILPLEKVGNEHARPKDGSSGSTLDWSGLQYHHIQEKFIFVVDGGKLASVVVAFDRELDKEQI